MEKCPVCQKEYKEKLPLVCLECGWHLFEPLYFEKIPPEEIEFQNSLLEAARIAYQEKKAIHTSLSALQETYNELREYIETKYSTHSEKYDEICSKLEEEQNHIASEIESIRTKQTASGEKAQKTHKQMEESLSDFSKRLATINEEVTGALSSSDNTIQDLTERTSHVTEELLSLKKDVDKKSKKLEEQTESALQKHQEQLKQAIRIFKEDVNENFVTINKQKELRDELIDTIKKSYEVSQEVLDKKYKRVWKYQFLLVSIVVILFLAGFMISHQLNSDIQASRIPLTSVSKTDNLSKSDLIVQSLDMVSIPAGSFEMGDITGDGFEDESPVHTVIIDEFMMSSSEITQSLYRMVMGESDPVVFTGSVPVEETWIHAARFCNRLSSIFNLEYCYDEKSWECDFSNNGFRLPTEAEWEYACRAGSQDDIVINSDSIHKVAWYYANSGNKVLSEVNNNQAQLMNNKCRPHPVKQKQPNRWGLYDMHGNAEEWCNDWYDSEYYTQSSKNNPIGSKTGFQRVSRGGSYISENRFLRPSSRVPQNVDDNTTAGFRVVRAVYY